MTRIIERNLARDSSAARRTYRKGTCYKGTAGCALPHLLQLCDIDCLLCCCGDSGAAGGAARAPHMHAVRRNARAHPRSATATARPPGPRYARSESIQHIRWPEADRETPADLPRSRGDAKVLQDFFSRSRYLDRAQRRQSDRYRCLPRETDQ